MCAFAMDVTDVVTLRWFWCWLASEVSVCGKSWWLCRALQRLPVCPIGPRQARIHLSYSRLGQRTGQNTPFDSLLHTGARGRR